MLAMSAEHQCESDGISIALSCSTVKVGVGRVLHRNKGHMLLEQAMADRSNDRICESLTGVDTMRFCTSILFGAPKSLY